MSITRSEIAGYQAFTVAGRRLSLTCLPGRGAHLTSLREGGHEWLWVPTGGPILAPVSADSDFKPHQEGCVDCFPTIVQEVVRGVRYEDHGQVWHRPWRVLAAVDRLQLAIDLPTCGVVCERTITADGDGLRLDWRICNRTASAVPYVWCWHPLFAWHPGDRLELPGASTVRMRRRRGPKEGSWPRPEPDYDLSTGQIGLRVGLKCYVPTSGTAILHAAGVSLAMHWDPLVLPWTGVYIRRGRVLKQWAVEPTNVSVDRLGELPAIPPEAWLPPHGERSWSIRLQPG